jgi:hypothetical protein
VNSSQLGTCGVDLGTVLLISAGRSIDVDVRRPVSSDQVEEGTKKTWEEAVALI